MEADKEFREWQPTFIKQFNVLKRLNISLAISLLRSLIGVGWEEVRFSDVEIKLLKSKIKFKLRFVEEGPLSLSS